MVKKFQEWLATQNLEQLNAEWMKEMWGNLQEAWQGITFVEFQKMKYNAYVRKAAKGEAINEAPTPQPQPQQPQPINHAHLPVHQPMGPSKMAGCTIYVDKGRVVRVDWPASYNVIDMDDLRKEIRFKQWDKIKGTKSMVKPYLIKNLDLVEWIGVTLEVKEVNEENKKITLSYEEEEYEFNLDDIRVNIDILDFKDKN